MWSDGVAHLHIHHEPRLSTRVTHATDAKIVPGRNARVIVRVIKGRNVEAIWLFVDVHGDTS